MEMEPRVEATQLPELTLLGYARRVPAPGPGPVQAIGEFWDEFLAGGLAARLPDSVIPGLLLGACWNEQPDGRFDYLIGVPVRTEAQAGADQVRLELPAARYLRCTVRGPKAEAIPAGFHWLFREWLPGSGLRVAPGACLEWYDHRAEADAEAEVDLFVPIQ
ncbi:MAG: GyrI-like domain-containing protein [Candidatus Delongbacteria bacterium]